MQIWISHIGGFYQNVFPEAMAFGGPWHTLGLNRGSTCTRWMHFDTYFLYVFQASVQGAP